MNRRLFTALLAVALTPLPAIADREPTHLDYTVSWVGNSFSGKDAWVLQDVADLCVLPDGTLFTNVFWDEAGGNVQEYRDGAMVGVAGHTHGWGYGGGAAVAANTKYLFIAQQVDSEGGGLQGNSWPGKGLTWSGVSKRPRADIRQAAAFEGGRGREGDVLHGAFLPIAEYPEGRPGAIRGLIATETRLYVSSPLDDSIKVYDTETMRLLESWAVPRPDKICLDKRGDIWVLQRPAASGAGWQAVCISESGAILPQKIVFPAGVVPTAVCAVPPRCQTSIDFVDANGVTTPFVRFGLWDNAFRTSTVNWTSKPPGVTQFVANPLYNASDEKDNFVGADSRRFYIRVTDPAAAGQASVKINWLTLWNDADKTKSNVIVAPGDQSLTLLPKSTNAGVFESQWLMLVTDPWELNNVTTTSGLPGDTILRKPGDADFRLRLATMFGSVLAEYTPSGPAASTPVCGTDTVSKKVPVFNRNPEERRRVPLQVLVLKTRDSPTFIDNFFAKDLPFIRSVYERLGIYVTTESHPCAQEGAWDAVRSQSNRDFVYLVDPGSPYDAGAYPPEAVTDVLKQEFCNAFPPSENTIRLIYVPSLGGDNGQTYSRDNPYNPFPNGDATSFVAKRDTVTAAAHEVGHTLTGKPVNWKTGHFNPPTNVQRYHELNNLKCAGGVANPFDGTIAYPGRLWDVVDADGVNQYTSDMLVPFQPAFVMVSTAFSRPHVPRRSTRFQLRTSCLLYGAEGD